jgi:hypothetical protein
LIFIAVGIQNLFSGDPRVFSISKKRTNQMMPMNIVLEDMEINKEKYSLLNAGQKNSVFDYSRNK